MKTRQLLIFLAAFYVMSCNEEETIQEGKVQFSFATADIGDSIGRTQVSDIPSGASLRITISRNNGEAVFTSKKIDLVKVGDAFVTTPLTLQKGQYTIDDFMIVSAGDSLLFATPKRESPLAQWVKNPLSVSFKVGGNTIDVIQGEVVSALRRAAKDFGYTSFGVRVASVPDFSVAAFTIIQEM